MMIKHALQIILLTSLPTSAICAQRVSIYIDQTFLVTGKDKPKIRIAATSDVTGKYDVHIGVISPKGKILEFPNWNTKFKPWLKNITIRKGFQWARSIFLG